MNNKLVYAHYTLDTNELFYIGIGDEVRSNNTSNRSEFWKRYYKKHGRRVEILYDNLTLEEAKVKEIELISKYGRINNKTGILVNLTDGGDGCEGLVHSLESKLKMSKVRIEKGVAKGSNNPMYGKKHTQKVKDISSKKVIDITTGVIYNSAKEVSDLFNINYSTLRAKLNGAIKTNNTNFKYLNND